jgi:hypothetical protein
MVNNMDGENESLERLKRLVDDALLARQDTDSLHNFFLGRATEANKLGIKVEGSQLLEYFWGLCRIGAVAVASANPGIGPIRIPAMFLTEKGRRLLSQRESSPHDPNRYMEAVKKRVAKTDPVTISYLQEAVEAWTCGLGRSSAVMLGCACERLVFLLADVIEVGGKCPPWSEKLKKKLNSRVFISDVFEDVRAALAHLRDQKKLSKELGDALDRKLSAVFDHARGLRNQSGHPTDESVSEDDAEAGLLLFPGFYELADQLISAISQL